MNECVVCHNEAIRCIPAPHAPYSRWLCDGCRSARRIAYQELVSAYSSDLPNDEVLGPYLEKFKEPTLSYFGISEDKFLMDVGGLV